MDTEEPGIACCACACVCFYTGRQCRYGDDAPVEEQMDCQTCPAYIMWRELVLGARTDPDNQELY